MIVRELIALLGFKIEDKGEAEAFERRLEKVQATALGVVGALAAVGAVAAAAVREFASSSADATDAAERIGTTTEALQELDYAATLGGASVDEVRQGLTALGAAAAGVTERGKATSEMLHGIGVATRDARGQARPTEDIFMDLAAALERIEDPGKRAAIAMRVFGGEGRGLVLMLNQGPAAIQRMREEARELGVVIGGDVVAAGNALDDQFQSLTFVARTLFRQLGAGVAQYVAPLVDATLKWVQANRQLVAARVAETGKVLGEVLQVLGRTMGWLVARADNLVHSFGGVKNALLTFAGVVALTTAVIAPSLVVTFGWIAALGLLAVAIGMAIEDISLFVSEGDRAKTSLGVLKKEFYDEDINPDDSSLVKLLKHSAKFLGMIADYAVVAGDAVRGFYMLLNSNSAAETEAARLVLRGAFGVDDSMVTAKRVEGVQRNPQSFKRTRMRSVYDDLPVGMNDPGLIIPGMVGSGGTTQNTDNRTFSIVIDGGRNSPREIANALESRLQSLEPSYVEVE